MKTKLLAISCVTVIGLLFLSMSAAPAVLASSAMPPSSQPSALAADDPTTVVIAQVGGSNTLDPQKPGGTEGGNIAFNVFEGLTVQSQDMTKVTPGLATEWKMLDNMTWQFKLRQGVKFQNGEDFNATAVKYTVDRLFMPKAVRNLYDFGDFAGVDIIDDYTINIKTKEPDPLVPAKVFGLSILPPKYDKEVGEDVFGMKPIGTGPYKVVEFAPGKQIVLEAFDGYWGTKPTVKRLVFKPVPEAATRLAELMSSQSDIVLSISPEDIPTIKAKSSLRVATTHGKRVPYVGLDLLPNGPKYLKDLRVRQALNYAVDVQGIIDAILLGYGEHVATVFRSDMVGYDPNLKPYAYDPAKAKQLLAEAGFKDGDITLKLSASDATTTKGVEIGEAIAGMLQKVGIKATVNALSNQTIRDMYIGGQEAHKGDALFLWNWGSREPDADSTLAGTVQSDGITSYLRDDKADAMIKEARTIMDPTQRAAKYQAIQQYLYDNCPFIFLYVADDLYGVNNRVTWTPRRDQYVLGVEMSIAAK